MTFERLVRPFERPRIAPAVPATALPATEPPEPIVLTFGATGSVKTMTGTDSSSVTAYMDDKQRETKRETVEKRVENPDDSSQYVDVENTTKITTEGGSRDTFQRRIFEYKEE